MAFAAALHAQTTSPASAGVYTAEQAQQGGVLYRNQCALCHGATLAGAGQIPELSGDDFMANWTGQPLADLFDKILQTMPGDKPGTLTREQTAALVAYILSSNKFPAGKTELPQDEESQKQIVIDKPKP